MTIVHGDDQLLNSAYPAKFRNAVQKKVVQRGIDLVLGDYVENMPAEGTVGLTTQNGKQFLNADLVVSI